jgi:large subunit ribosomal protein L15
MKLHDLRPAPGAHTAKTRVGRGIAAGKGKTAGRGTKGQKARAGGTIPPWFEGGQTPLHIRIPKLRGFKNRFKIQYEVVNLGDINRLVELGELATGDHGDHGGASAPASRGKTAPITVNQEILRAAGLVSTLAKPLKVLGQGEVSAALFVVADAFSKSAAEKIEAAGGTAQTLETPQRRLKALTGTAKAAPAEPAPKEVAAPEPVEAPEPAESRASKRAPKAAAETAVASEPAEAEEPATAPDEEAAAPTRRSRSKPASPDADGETA